MPNQIFDSSLYSESLTGVFNAIKVGNYDLFMTEFRKDEQRLNNHYSGGCFGGSNSLLHVAVYYNFPDIVDVLLDRGIELEARTQSGYTALMIACVCGHYEIVCKLIDRGADIRAKEDSNPHPRSCMDLIHSTIKDDVIEYLRPKSPPPIVAVVQMTAQEKKADERRRIQEKFNDADEDGSGELDVGELGKFCATLGTVLNEEELEAALLILDESGDGQISFDEFADWWLDD